jgi:hypothetical protein
VAPRPMPNIVGVPRSGATLLRFMLESHPYWPSLLKQFFVRQWRIRLSRTISVSKSYSKSSQNTRWRLLGGKISGSTRDSIGTVCGSFGRSLSARVCESSIAIGLVPIFDTTPQRERIGPR